MLLVKKNELELVSSGRLVKAADKLSALIKCVEERKAGNSEFISAERSTRESIEKMGVPEADYFMKYFMPAFELDLDELGIGG